MALGDGNGREGVRVRENETRVSCRGLATL